MEREKLGMSYLQPKIHNRNYSYIQENDHSLLCEGLDHEDKSNVHKSKNNQAIGDQFYPESYGKNN